MKIRYKIVNLKNATARRASMERQLKDAGLLDQTDFFAAVEGESLKHQRADEIRQTTKLNRYFYRTGMSWNEVGCFLSHRTLWQELVNDEAHDFYVILEDDVTIHPDLERITEAALQAGSYDFVRLHSSQTRPSQGSPFHSLQNGFNLCLDFGPHPELHHLPRALWRTKWIFYSWFFGTAGYMISKEGARRFFGTKRHKNSPPCG